MPRDVLTPASSPWAVAPSGDTPEEVPPVEQPAAGPAPSAEPAHPRGRSGTKLAACLLTLLTVWLASTIGSRGSRAKRPGAELVVRRGVFDESFGLAVNSTLWLDRVAPGGPADVAGAGRFVGRRVTHVDGRQMASGEDLVDALQGVTQVVLRFSGPAFTPAPPVLAVGASVIALRRIRFASGKVVQKGSAGKVARVPGDNGAWAEVSFDGIVFDAKEGQVAMSGTPEAVAALQATPPPTHAPEAAAPRPAAAATRPRVPAPASCSGQSCPQAEIAWRVGGVTTKFVRAPHDWMGHPVWREALEGRESVSRRLLFADQKGHWTLAARLDGEAEFRTEGPAAASTFPYGLPPLTWARRRRSATAISWERADVSCYPRYQSTQPPAAQGVPPSVRPRLLWVDTGLSASRFRLDRAEGEDSWNSRPTWRDDWGRRLFTNNGGYWMLGDADGPQRNRGELRSRDPHQGKMPHAAGPWVRLEGIRGHRTWQDASAASVSALELPDDARPAAQPAAPVVLLPTAPVVDEAVTPRYLILSVDAEPHAVFTLDRKKWNKSPAWHELVPRGAPKGRRLWTNNGGYWMVGPSDGREQNRGTLKSAEMHESNELPHSPQMRWQRLEGKPGVRQWKHVSLTVTGRGDSSSEGPPPDDAEEGRSPPPQTPEPANLTPHPLKAEPVPTPRPATSPPSAADEGTVSDWQ